MTDDPESHWHEPRRSFDYSPEDERSAGRFLLCVAIAFTLLAAGCAGVLNWIGVE